MENLLNKSVAEMTGLSFECGCGKKHEIAIEHILIGNGVLPKLAALASRYKSGKLFLMADANTYQVCGKKAETILLDAGFDLKKYVFDTKSPLVPDEKALGRLLVEMEEQTALIISVGSGSLNDLARMLSCKCHIPYFIVATAPSMDGYASTVSPLIIDGFKTTYGAVSPTAIIADLPVISQAPMEMIRSGFGDIIGKYTALADWILSREVNGEYYCDLSARLMNNAVQKCVDNIDGIARRDETAVRYLTEALILSGVAMGLVGNSRPASGAEHHMAHYWEMDALAKGREHPLHGNSVGAAAVVSASLYRLMKDRLPAKCTPPDPDAISEMLRRTGAAETPKKLGIDRELFYRSVLHAMEIRERYTILRFASQCGKLDEYAQELTRGFYGES